MWEEIKTFFVDLGFDNFISVINCFVGIIALFVGGKTYSENKKIKKAYNDEKYFADNGIDNSQKAAGDITNNYCDTNALVALSTENFKICLNEAQQLFERKTEENLHKITDEAQRIINENKINLGAYTKIDWINIYFDSAKNASDSYMQNIWAKVLARELSQPGSFSYKTLDVLKNMSADDFHIFEKLCSICIEDYILQGKNIEKQIQWRNQLKLQELGLINLTSSTHWILVEANSSNCVFSQDNTLVARLQNDKNRNVNVEYNVYLISEAAKQLMLITDYEYCNDIFYYFVEMLRTEFSDMVKITLHKLNRVEDKKYNYQPEDLLASKQTVKEENL